MVDASFKEISHFMKLGDSYQLELITRPSDTTDVIDNFYSEDPTIASVDKKGLVTATGLGRTRITASVKSFFGTKSRGFRVSPIIIEVTASGAYEDDIASINASDFPVSEKTLSLDSRRSSTFKATINLYPNNSTDIVSYRSLDGEVASVDSNGVIKAHSPGVTYISATITGKDGSPRNYRYRMKVIVLKREIPVTEVSFTEDYQSISLNSDYQSELVIEPGDTTDYIRYVSSNEDLVSVDDKGLMIAKKSGTISIKAYAYSIVSDEVRDLSATMTLHVE